MVGFGCSFICPFLRILTGRVEETISLVHVPERSLNGVIHHTGCSPVLETVLNAAGCLKGSPGLENTFANGY